MVLASLAQHSSLLRSPIQKSVIQIVLMLYHAACILIEDRYKASPDPFIGEHTAPIQYET